MRLDYQKLKSPLLTLLAGSGPAENGKFAPCVVIRPSLEEICNVEHAALTIIFSRGGSRGVIGAIASHKTYERNFIYHDFVQFGNSIGDIWPFCRPLFCHRIVVKYISPLLQ